jgi:double-stranded uracil-DNA glycosylase
LTVDGSIAPTGFLVYTGLALAYRRLIRSLYRPGKAAQGTASWGAMRVLCFEPIADAASTRLILGTAPGIASLRAGEYYAHPRNAFWDIAEAWLDIQRSLRYRERVALLRGCGVALWDVLAACTRPTSLDSDIAPGSIQPNDFAAFYAAHPAIRAIYFNGGNAEALYRRHVYRSLPAQFRGIPARRLPSTSPANARLNTRAKLVAWAPIRSQG